MNFSKVNSFVCFGKRGHHSIFSSFPVFHLSSFDGPGVVAMASRGAHTNNSQFFITTQALPWMRTRAVAFGKVVRGLAVMRAIEQAPCIYERPEDPIKIEKAGEVDLSSVFDIK